MGTFLFSILVGASIASFGGALLELLSAWRERSIARRRAMSDRDASLYSPGWLDSLLHRDVADGLPGEPEQPESLERRDLALRIRLFAIGLFVSSLVAVPLGLGFAGTFALILTCSVVLSLAPSISSSAGFLALLLVLSLGSCGAPGGPRRNQIQGTHNMWVNRDLRERQVAGAVIADAQFTERHFTTGSAELNELGQRDAEILAGHLREHGGEVGVRRGSASDELYQERLYAVSFALIKAASAGLNLEVTATGVAVVSTEPKR
jgi:hypothetical protein